MKFINLDDFKVVKNVSLSQIPTNQEINLEKLDKQDRLDRVRNRLSKLQDVMYAHNKYSVLICLQGMDTSGKDSLIREVFKEFNPRGVAMKNNVLKMIFKKEFGWF